MAHGVFFESLNAAGAPITIQTTRVVGLAAPVPAGATGFSIGDFKVIRGPTDVQALGLAPTDDLQYQLDGLFAQARAPVILFGTDPGADQAALETNLAGSASLNTGVYKFKEAQQTFGFKPKVVIAPGQSAATVHAALVGCCEAIRAVTILDGPDTDDAAAIAAAGAISDGEGRSTMSDPWHVNGAVTLAPSASIAGIYAKTDWWRSPSNKTINGITGTTRAIFHELTNDADEAQALNDANIMTTVQNQGFRTWGNRNLSASGYALPFISDVIADDVIREALAQAHLFWVDQPLTRKTFADNLLRSLNAFFDKQVALDRLVGAEATLDPDINTAATLEAGQIYINYEVTYASPAENITFRRAVTNRFYE